MKKQQKFIKIFTIVLIIIFLLTTFLTGLLVLFWNNWNIDNDYINSDINIDNIISWENVAWNLTWNNLSWFNLTWNDNLTGSK